VKQFALILLSGLIFSGCFVIDEIDKGNAILDQHGGRARKQREAAAAAAAAEESAAAKRRSGPQEPGVKEQLSKWWQEVSEEGPAPPDPNNGIVRCTIGGTIAFTREKECKIRGGRAAKVPKTRTVSTPPKPDAS
jgi:hypothetical protein